MKLISMACLEFLELLLVLLLSLGKNAIPVLVEFLVLLNMSVLDFLLALLVLEHELLILHVEFLFLELEDAVLSHFGLW